MLDSEPDRSPNVKRKTYNLKLLRSRHQGRSDADHRNA